MLSRAVSRNNEPGALFATKIFIKFRIPSILPPREATKAVRGKRELWAVVQANARHARDVAAAVDARDLEEVKRIVDRAKLTRHDFASVCDRLGFRSRDEVKKEKNESCCGEGGEGETSAIVLGGPPIEAGKPTPPAVTPGEAETNGAEENKAAAVVDAAMLLGGVPVFFLDAEGRGGTTALALATIENDAETVRRLMKEVSL